MFQKFVICLVGIAICSVQAQEERIIGGQVVPISQFPFQVSLQLNNQHICGGSINTNLFIVTAAHCVARFEGNTTGLSIVAGRSRLGDNDGQRVPVNRITVHPDFNPSNNDRDVAVLRLARPLTFNTNVRAIDISASSPGTNTLVTVTGWGSTRRGGDSILSNDLKAASVRVQAGFVCRVRFLLTFTERMFCAGNALGGGDDACKGDDGGPVSHNNEQVGIIIGGGCGTSLGRYTDTRANEGFILRATRN